jgi:hypothetical protein
MTLIGQPRLRGFCSRPEPSSPNLSLLFLVHLRERIRPTHPKRKPSLLPDRLGAPGFAGALTTFW